MKLLYVINHIDWFWSHRLPLALGAQDAGHDVHVAVTGAVTDETLSKNGFTGHELPDGHPVYVLLALHRIFKDQKPDIVHAITLKYAFFAGLAALFHPRIKIVHTIAGLGYLFSGEGVKPKILRTLIGPLLKLALKSKRTQLIFQNPDDLALLTTRGFADPARCTLIRGSGVDITQFDYVPEPDQDTPLIIMPTRLVHDKGVAVFVEAARIVRERGINARFQIAGGVTANNPLAISKIEMENMVADGAAEWLGKVSDMPALFAACHLVVYPSYYREGIPKVLLEAAATGRAIITTDHPGCREAVNDGQNGFLVPVKDAVATADAVEKILADAEMRATMGAESRKRAEEEFAVTRIVAETLAVYNI